MTAELYEALYRDLRAFMPEHRLVRDPLRTLAYGTDASFYRLVPRLVAVVESEDEVACLLRACRRLGLPVTFRAAGTSLSGQAITDSVLVLLGDGWNGCTVGPGAETVRLQPGVIGADANRRLARFRRKIGPDPASISAAKIGGIAANNASGMCCGTAQNSYQTLAAMRVILADGSRLDTGDPASRTAFAAGHGALLGALAELGRRTRADTALAGRIRHKFAIKNTTGYSLNALIDFEDPVDILQHLMIGSEGTLGFIAEITYRTVPDHADKASALALFPDLAEACRAVARLKSAPVSAVELMDRAALRSVEGQPGMPTVIAGLDGSAVALLIEVRAGDAAALRADIATVTEALAGFRTLRPAAFSTDAGECAQLWQIRKGLFPAVGARRRTGTTVIIEDVAFPIARLAEATLELQALFARHGYHEAIIFGHALEGNLHFVFTQDFGRGEEVERYRHFMDALCRMVVETYDGSLKAEHGTGRNMAPFVAMEWGTQAYGLMRAIKRLFDPEGLLNPGVILNDDPQAHLKDLKALPAADPLVDTCIECGFCEPQCPSHGLTLSPRQRIVGWRAISRLAASSGSGADRAHETALRRLYDYQGLDTCAACGLCATTCPVGIETGALTKSLRGRRRTGAERRFGAWAARRYGALMTVTGGALTLAGWARRGLGATAVDAIGRTLRRLSGGRLPLWTSAQPTGAHWTPPALVTASDGRPCVVYVPSCASRTMGPAVGDPETTPLPERFAALLAKAGYGVVYPPDLGNLCCGQPFASKGLAAIAAAKAGEMAAAVLRVSENGALPVVLDTSPCALHLKEHLAGDDRLTVHDVTGFIHDHLLGRLDLVKQPGPVLLHATCSTRRMGLDAKLQAIAEACAETVVVPDGIGCCGFAGDKGFTTPELNDHALRHLKAAVPAGCAAGYSTSRTCEIGLSSHAGVPYRSIVDLVEACAAERTSSGRVPNTRAGGPIADATPYRRGAPR